MAILITDAEALAHAKAHPVCIGVDVGKIHDPVAIAVSEVAQVPTGKYRYLREPVQAHIDAKGQFVPPHDADPVLVSEYTVRHIKRLPLGTSYPEVAVHLADLLCSPLFAYRAVRMLIDVTGVGRPVYDDVVKEIALRKGPLVQKADEVGFWFVTQSVQIKPISFVRGETYNKRTGSLGKAFLVSRMQSLLQGHRVHGPVTPEMQATIEELKVYEIKIDTDGKDTYGASTGKHDDLATALGLSCLEDPFGDRVTYSKRVY